MRLNETSPIQDRYAVTLEDVAVRRGNRLVLDHVFLSIRQGEITGLLGPNGAGKTTLLSVIMGLLPVSSGTLTVFGEQDLVRRQTLRSRIGIVLQETALYDELTTLENLQFAAALYDVPNADTRIGEVLDLLALSSRARDRAGQLSGGLRRRVTIARALLPSPELLIVDEPTLGVDVEARHTIWSHLRLLRSGGTTVIVSTNYLDEALALCDQAAVLRDGRILVMETPEALVARAGTCLDIACRQEDQEAIAAALTDTQSVYRITTTPSGVSVFLEGSAVPDLVLRQVMAVAAITGFRLRGADMAEVFHALDDLQDDREDHQEYGAAE
jgi:ABC-2 type transport system ATP-binding protein